MNALEKLVDLLAAFVLLFVLPLLYYHGKTQLYAQTAAGQECERFLSRCSIFGEVLEAYYTELERELNAYGCRRFEVYGERELYLLRSGELEIRRVQKETEFFINEMKEQGTSILMPGDRLSVVVYFDDVPTVYSTVVRSGGRMK